MAITYFSYLVALISRVYGSVCKKEVALLLSLSFSLSEVISIDSLSFLSDEEVVMNTLSALRNADRSGIQGDVQYR